LYRNYAANGEENALVLMPLSFVEWSYDWW
jgi:hypothetical protein